MGRFAIPALIIIVLLLVTGTTIAQDSPPTVPPETDTDTATPTPTEDPQIVTATQAAIIEATQTQVVIDATGTSVQATQSVIDATATGQFFATQTATVRPRPTDTFQPIGVAMFVEPRTTTGNYNPGDMVRFTIRVWNIGEFMEDRTLNVVTVYDTKTFRVPSAENISEGGQSDGGTISWAITDGLFPGEDSARVFTFQTNIRSDLTESIEGTVETVVSNRGGVLLTQIEPMRIPVVVKAAEAPPVNVTGQVPQGEGLFKEANSFALLIGVFFGIGIVFIFLLGALVIYLSQDDEAKESTFTGTTEVVLLLIVLFSVIIMGVQNAIDRESINAIIGGIVGYVAGRVRTRIGAPRSVASVPDSGQTAPRGRFLRRGGASAEPTADSGAESSTASAATDAVSISPSTSDAGDDNPATDE